jgi:predicted Zn-dependent protease
MLAHLGQTLSGLVSGSSDGDEIVSSSLSTADLLSQVEMFRKAGQLMKADRWLAQYVERFPGDEAICAEFARNALLRNDPATARQRWELFVSRFPSSPGGICNLADLLIHVLKEFDLAEEILGSAGHRFPNDVNVAVYFAAVAGCRGDNAEALVRWKHADALDPDHAFTKLAIAEIEAKIESLSKRKQN